MSPEVSDRLEEQFTPHELAVYALLDYRHVQPESNVGHLVVELEADWIDVERRIDRADIQAKEGAVFDNEAYDSLTDTRAMVLNKKGISKQVYSVILDRLERGASYEGAISKASKAGQRNN